MLLLLHPINMLLLLSLSTATAAGTFSAGFNFKLFGTPAMEDVLAKRQDVVRELAALLEGGAKPSVAAIAGACLGGGCELAMACNARVCAEGAFPPERCRSGAGERWSSSWSGGRLPTDAPLLLPSCSSPPLVQALLSASPRCDSACCRAWAARSACRAWWAWSERST